MNNLGNSSEILDLLNDAIARELQVCIQYMLQHAIGAGQASATSGKKQLDKQSKFVGTHWPYFMPGSSLKKIAITEMRHAEAIAERVVHLGGEPTTQADPIIIGKTIKEMLEIDRDVERRAIELYRQIIEVAGKEHDDETISLFRSILSDEEKHHREFSDLLAED